MSRRLARGHASPRAAPTRVSSHPALVAEPGRTLVANPVVTLYRVGARKEAGGRTLVAVDGGMSDNLRPMLYDARFQALAASRPAASSVARSRPSRWSASTANRATCSPRTCRCPPTSGPGDLIAFAATGAYTYSLATRVQPGGPPRRGRRPRRGPARPGSAGRTPPTWTGSRRRPPARVPTDRGAGGRHDPPRAAPRRRVVRGAVAGGRRRGPVRAQRDAWPIPPASTARGSGGRGPTTRRSSWRWRGSAWSATSTSSASAIRSRATWRRSVSRWRPTAVATGSARRSSTRRSAGPRAWASRRSCCPCTPTTPPPSRSTAGSGSSMRAGSLRQSRRSTGYVDEILMGLWLGG